LSRRAIVTIEPRGPKSTERRQFLIRFTLELDGVADKAAVLALAHAALEPLGATAGAECAFGELAIKTKTTSIEARVSVTEAPSEAAIGDLRSSLSAAGYTVTITDSRECDECLASVMVPWGQVAPPTGWHSSAICGKHQYRSCPGCASVYVMSSTNANGPAPSLRCTVCDEIMVEWGGTKVWFAELVSGSRAGE
jgi:hypothetical protein